MSESSVQQAGRGRWRFWPANLPLGLDILLRLLGVALLASILLVLVFFNTYQRQLEQERSQASLGFNLLLQAALENAMLKRDVPGLADMVRRLGEQPGMRQVLILNPAGEVRFASHPDLLGQRLPALVPDLRASDHLKPKAEFTHTPDGGPVLRSINPVRNKLLCGECHGSAEQHPVNGILVVDYDATALQQQAWQSALWFTAACFAILLLSLAVLWFALKRKVLQPVAALNQASMALAEGVFHHRLQIQGEDELARLGHCFNSMAERIQAQLQALETQQQYLQQVLDSLPDGLRVIRVRDMQVVLANRAYAEQLGIDPAEAVQHPCYQGSHQRGEACVPTLVLCPVNALHETGKRLKVTHHHVRADGTSFPVETHAVRVEIGEGAACEPYIVESIRDLSQVARISQNQRLSELGLLAAGIAHEIHNPLASVKLGVQGLSRDMVAGRCTPDLVVDYLGLIDSEIDKCVVVTRRLLLLSRTPAETPHMIDVGQAVDDALRLLEYDAQGRRIQQTFEPALQPLRVLADEGELRMVFLNLLQNAHHAMPDGGHLLARVYRSGAMAGIDIRDTGAGIDPEILPRIFDPFFSSRADEVSGTGLGLTIVKNIVERYGGSIRVDSIPGQGALFRVYLPLVDGEGEMGA